MGLIKDDFNRMLQEDYVLDEDKSVVYKHYKHELEESVKRFEEKKSGKLSAAGCVCRAWKDMGEDPDEKEVFSFLTETFSALSETPELYDQPLYTVDYEENRQINEKNKNREKQQRERVYINDNRDFEIILDVVWPYLSYGLGLGEKEHKDLKKDCIKSRLRAYVRKLAEKIESEPEGILGAYKKAGLLKKDEKLGKLYNHILERSIDRSYKDYLYTEGYTLHRLRKEDLHEGSGSFLSKLPEGKGRKSMKPDKILSLLDSICEKRGILSLTGDVLDDPEYMKAVVNLYDFVSRSYRNGEDVTLDLLLALDRDTGVSLHLVGNSITGDYPPCAFMVMYRYDDDCTTLYYKDTNLDGEPHESELDLHEPINEEDESTNEEDDETNSESLYKQARAAYKIGVREARDDIRDANDDYVKAIRENMTADMFKYFAYSLPEEPEFYDDTDLRKSVKEDIHKD